MSIEELRKKSGNNKPYIVHPDISGTLCASGAGLSRPAGMASETDLCIAYCMQENTAHRNGSEVNEDTSFTFPFVFESHGQDARYTGPHDIAPAVTSSYGMGGGDTRNNDSAGNGLGVGKSGDPAPTITSGDKHAVAAYCLQGNMIGREDHNGPRGDGVNEEISFTLTATDVAAVAAVDCRNFREEGDISGTLQSKGSSPGYSLNCQNPVRLGYIVRRLTPTECERLQGYPDGWTAFTHEGKPISDTARYMMLGNSVAVPCVAYILMGIAAAHGKETIQ